MLKKGWFTKAKYKFVKKRVLYWEFYYRGLGSSFVSYELQVDYFDHKGLTYGDRFDKRFYVLREIEKLGFIKGFWAARKIARRDDDWRFTFEIRGR